MIRKQKGFTLIELLVVVAIIGILSGIAFVSIRGARESAYDTQIKSELSQIRSNAEQWYYENGGEYTDYTTSDGWTKIQDAIPPCSIALLPETGCPIDGDFYQVQVASDGQGYAAWAPLCGASDDTTTVFYCVDSEGDAGEYEGVTDLSESTCGDIFTTEL